MFGLSKKQLIIAAIALIVVIRFRDQIAGALARIPLVNKAAGVG